MFVLCLIFFIIGCLSFINDIYKYLESSDKEKQLKEISKSLKLIILGIIGTFLVDWNQIGWIL